MEQKPNFSAKYPWLVAQNFTQRRILPLTLKDSDSQSISSPPDDFNSVLLLLTRNTQLHHIIERLGFTYAPRNINDEDALTSSNGCNLIVENCSHYNVFGLNEVGTKTLGVVYIFKLDMTGIKDAIFLVDNPSDLGRSYIRILGEIHKIMYSPTKCPRLLQGDQDEIKFRADSKQEGMDNEEDEIILNSVSDYEEVGLPHKEITEYHLFNVPFDLLETIMKFCVGVEYLKFRATCKTCHLAAPMIRWKVSPCLMVLDDKHPGVITFTDPICGDTYYRNLPRQLSGDLRIHCSRYGWLLMTEVKIHGYQRLVFFNPFTSEMHKLPKVPSLESFCFSAPPTSPDCMVVGFHKSSLEWRVYIHFVARETSWRILLLDLLRTHGPHFLSFPTFSPPDIYGLSNGGRLVAIGEIGEKEAYSHRYLSGFDLAGVPQTCCRSLTKNYLVERDQDLLQVIVGQYGESVEVFMFNGLKEEWERIDGLGRHMIYICDVTCVCIEAKRQEMENRIYFPRLHSENGKIVFYSFETSMYHTSSDVNMMDFVGTKQHIYPHAWIQPNW